MAEILDEDSQPPTTNQGNDGANRMAVINADGLFYGERLAKCSDLAQLWWPRFYHASNGYGRIEISYDEFLRTAMRNIRLKLTKQEFIAIIQEYQANYLLFLYRVGGSLWGQWVGGEENLPRYKSASDRRSPEAPAAALKAFIEEYEKKKSDSQILEVFVNVSQQSAEVRNVTQVCESSRNVSLGVGVGGGVGDGVGEEQEKAERVSLKVSPLNSGEDTIRQIAYEHPKLQHLAKNNKPLPSGLERVIWQRVDEDGKDSLLAGTLNLRDAVAKWPPGNERFIPNPLKFYDEREYLKDPKVWERPDGKERGYVGEY